MKKMSDWVIACSSITWPRGTPGEQVLAEIAQAGFAITAERFESPGT